MRPRATELDGITVSDDGLRVSSDIYNIGVLRVGSNGEMVFALRGGIDAIGFEKGPSSLVGRSIGDQCIPRSTERMTPARRSSRKVSIATDDPFGKACARALSSVSVTLVAPRDRLDGERVFLDLMDRIKKTYDVSLFEEGIAGDDHSLVPIAALTSSLAFTLRTTPA